MMNSHLNKFNCIIKQGQMDTKLLYFDVGCEFTAHAQVKQLYSFQIDCDLSSKAVYRTMQFSCLHGYAFLANVGFIT